MQVQGWGGYPAIEAQVYWPAQRSACASLVQTGSLIPRGLGRSYGDSASAARVMQTDYLDHFIAFDVATGVLVVEAGVSLREILELVVPTGWCLAVSPGTSYVTVGGAIASDVHGKNHQIAGTFGQHVEWLTVLLGNGDVVTASSTEHADLFHATCGGMGLTGVVLTASLQLQPIRSSYLQRTTYKASCLDEAFALFEEHNQASYSVAWIDCLAQGKNMGRSLVKVAEPLGQGDLHFSLPQPLTVPIHLPAFCLNRWSIKAFNSVYFNVARADQAEIVPLNSYLYELDSIGHWNRIYGKAGFVQYQCVIPQIDGLDSMHKLLSKISASGSGSFLAVLKQFGAANQNTLSFPMPGYTLALDFKWTPTIARLCRELDEMVCSMGGRVYLTKDALLDATSFRLMYPQWEKFEEVRAQYGAVGKFASAQSTRLGLQ